MSVRSSPLVLAGIAVGAALVVAGVWCGRPHTPVVLSALDGTVALAITRHDAFGMPGKPTVVRDRARVRAIVAALGVDGQPPVPCPADYASAEIGMLLTGSDVYARRNVYLWRLLAAQSAAEAHAHADASAAVTEAPSVLVVTSSGCRGGAPADAAALRQELVAFGRTAPSG